jgi:hypothetical protein
MWWLLAACDPRAPAPPETSWTFRGAVFPEGPGDVLVLDLDQRRPDDVLVNVEPVVQDAAGRPVELELRSYLGFGYGWAPAGGFVPGDYVLRGAADFPVERQDPFTVAPFGQEAVEGAGLVGRSWELVAGRTAPQDLGPIGFAQGTAAIVVEAVDGDALTFALVFRNVDQDCVVLRDAAAWDEERGAMRWEVVEQTLTLPTTSGDVALDADDLWLEVEWLAEDTSRAVGQASGSIDTRPLSELLDPGSGPEGACAIAQQLGFPCVACDDGEPTCLGVQVVQGSLRETDRPLDASSLPVCGLDRIDPTLPDFTLSCDLPIDVALDPAACGCAAPGRQAGAPLLVVAALVLRRRSRQTTYSRG